MVKLSTFRWSSRASPRFGAADLQIGRLCLCCSVAQQCGGADASTRAAGAPLVAEPGGHGLCPAARFETFAITI